MKTNNIITARVSCVQKNLFTLLSCNEDNSVNSELEITGKLIQILPNVEGDSARGHWVRGGFVIETGDDYPRKVAFNAFGEERIAMVQNVPMGSMVRRRSANASANSRNDLEGR